MVLAKIVVGIGSLLLSQKARWARQAANLRRNHDYLKALPAKLRRNAAFFSP